MSIGLETNPDRQARGERARAALAEFLDPAFDVVIGDYMLRLTQIASETPWESDKITKLASAAKIAEQVRAQIRAVVADGEVAVADIKRAREIEKLPTARRKFI